MSVDKVGANFFQLSDMRFAKAKRNRQNKAVRGQTFVLRFFERNARFAKAKRAKCTELLTK